MGQVLHACTLEARVGEAPRIEVREVRAVPDRGFPYVGLEVAGQPGVLAGVNAAGISASFEAFPLPGEDVQGSVAPAVALQRVLERADGLAEAERILREHRLGSGARFTIADGRRLLARVVEVYGPHVNVRQTVDGFVFGEEPGASVECYVGQCDPAVPQGSGADDVALRRQLSETAGRVRAPFLRQALVQQPVLRQRTSAVCVLEPQLGRMRYALRSALEAASPPEWKTLDLLTALGKERAARYAPPWEVTSTGEFVVDPKTSRLGKITLTRVAFDSPAPSGIPQNDRINGILYRPETVKGAVIALPAWKESNLAGQSVLALRLAADGYAVLVMPLPWQVDRAVPGVGSGSWTLSDNLARTRAAFFQGAADVARASLWLEQAQGIPPARQAVMGVSLGGHIAALAYGAYPQRFGAGVFLLAGGNFETALLNPNRTTGRMRKALLDRGVTPEEAKDLIEAIDGVR
jgi:dienelactone hydrolase